MKYLAMVLAGLLLAAGLQFLRMTEGERAQILHAAPGPAAAGGAMGIAAPDPAPALPAAVATADAPAPAAVRRDSPAVIERNPVLPPGLVVPVRGVAPSQLSPTFDDDRGEGRMHEALDIMAPAGTPVLAVADGHVEKLFDSERGGLTIYQFEPDGRFAYYYAHLERYAPGLREGQAVARGEVIGYVGSSGNADPAAPHLHFAIFLLGPEKRWWEGTAIDPWPLLSGTPASGDAR